MLYIIAFILFYFGIDFLMFRCAMRCPMPLKLLLCFTGGAMSLLGLMAVLFFTSEAAGGIYLLIVTAIIYLAVTPALKEEEIMTANPDINQSGKDDIYFSEEDLDKFSSAKPEKKLPEYTRSEFVLSVLCLALAFGFVKLVLFCTTGFLTTALYIAIITAVVIYLRHKGFTFGRMNTALTAVLYLFSLVFSVTANDLIKNLTAVFLFGAGAYLVYSVTAGKSDVERFLPAAMLKALFEYPLSRFGAQFTITRSAMGDSRVGSTVKPILLGLLLTVPLTSVVGALLMSADAGLETMLTNIMNAVFSADVRMIILQLAIAFPCSFYLFGMIYANSFRSGISELSEERCEEGLRSVRIVRNLVIYTAVTPILVLYVMFFISQAPYFLSAFSGHLPEGYSCSEYARRGFFELFAVTLINLGVIGAMSLHAREGGENKPPALKIYTVTLSVFTLVLISTAVSKMLLYISEFGLTQLRVYTTWFMLLCAVIFILIIIKQFRWSFRFARWCSIAFTVLFGVLCFSRPDSLIAAYNVNMYRSGKLKDMDTCAVMELSDDGILTALRLGAVTAEEAESERGWELSKDPYSRMNISSALLEEELNK